MTKGKFKKKKIQGYVININFICTKEKEEKEEEKKKKEILKKKNKQTFTIVFKPVDDHI